MDDRVGDQLVGWGKVLLLETTGRVSGLAVRTPIGFIEAADGTLGVAAGDPSADWVLNLQARSTCRVTLGERTLPCAAEELVGDQRAAVIRELILKYGTPAERLGSGARIRASAGELTGDSGPIGRRERGGSGMGRTLRGTLDLERAHEGTPAGTEERFAMPKGYTRLLHPLVREGDRRTGRLREATWDEALDRAAAGFRTAVERHGPSTFGLFSCSKATNELNFINQKFARTVIGSNNIDSCNRT